MEEQREVQNEIIEEVQRYYEDTNLAWKELQKTEGFTFRKYIAGNSKTHTFPVYSIETSIQAPPELIFEMLLYVQKQKEWDSSCQDSRIIETFDLDNHIVYEVLKPSFPTKPRDLCYYRYSRTIESKKQHIILMRSVQHRSCSPKEGYVRASNYSRYSNYQTCFHLDTL
jgi:hypothetical protein